MREIEIEIGREKRSRGRRDWEKYIELKSRLTAREKITVNERIKITNKKNIFVLREANAYGKCNPKEK